MATVSDGLATVAEDDHASDIKSFLKLAKIMSEQDWFGAVQKMIGELERGKAKSKQLETAYNKNLDSLGDAKQDLKQEKAKFAELTAEKERLRDEKDSDINRLKKEKENEINDLKKKKDSEVKKLREEKDREINKLQEKKTRENTALRKAKEAEIVTLQECVTALNTKLADANKNLTEAKREVTGMKAADEASKKKISELKAEVEREKSGKAAEEQAKLNMQKELGAVRLRLQDTSTKLTDTSERLGKFEALTSSVRVLKENAMYVHLFLSFVRPLSLHPFSLLSLFYPLFHR